MRTTLDIDEKLLGEVLSLTNEKSRGRAVDIALADFVRRKRIEDLRAMLGQFDLDDTWSELRHMEHQR